MSKAAKVTRKQLVDDARNGALAGNWEEVIEMNQQLLERTPKDAEARNRLGRAYLALGQMTEAVEAYQSSLRVDPANLIARRNLQRLELLRHQSPVNRGKSAGEVVNSTQRTAVFIEEVGKTWVDELVNPIDPETLAQVFPGEQLGISDQDGRLVISRENGDRLGEVEAKTAGRMANLMRRGNRYEVYALGTSGQSLRVILREVFRDPSVLGEVSFPRQITSRSYFRERDLLRARDESDFFLSDDDDDDDDLSARDEEDEPSGDDTDPDTEDLVVVPDDEDSPI